jgi:hypothetical protein
VPRRVSLPSADELFRRTRFPEERPGAEEQSGANQQSGAAEPPGAATASEQGVTRSGRPSGRVRHDEKITIYVTADELLTLEHTRLSLRAHHGLAVDRGRIVREAIHLALRDVAEQGDQSALVRRLREQ